MIKRNFNRLGGTLQKLLSMHVRMVMAAVVCGLWPIASADFGEKIIADVKSSDKPEFHLQFAEFDSYNPSSKTKQYSTRYKNSDSNTHDALSHQPYEGSPISSIVAPPINFKSEINTDEAPTDFNYQVSKENIELNSQSLPLERSDIDLNEQPVTTGKRRINSKVFRKRLRERLRQRLQNDTVNSSANSEGISTTSKPASAFRSRARSRGASKTSSAKESASGHNSEKNETLSVPNQRVRSGTARRGNNTFYTKYRGRTPSAITNSRGLRLRSRVTTTTTTEKVATQSQVSYIPSSSDQPNLQLDSEVTKIDNSIQPSPIDTSKMKQTGITDEFVPASGSTNFEDIFSDFRSKQRNVKITKKPKSPSQRYQVAAPEVLPTTVAIHTRTNNQNVETFTVTKQPSMLQSSFNVATFSPEKNFVSPTPQIRSTVYQFGPSFSAVEHDKNQNHQLSKGDKPTIIKLEPQEFHLNYEHISESKKDCDSQVNDPQCKSPSGFLNTNILESTRDIIKQAETAEVFRERSRPLRVSKTARPPSWHDAPAPNVVQPFPTSGKTPGPVPGGQPTSSDGSLYRDDVLSGSSSASWHQRRPKQELEAGTKDSRAKIIQSADFYEATTPRPAVFTTFEHFLRIHGVTESPFTVVQAPSNHSLPLAVSYQNSYHGSFDEFSKTTSESSVNMPQVYDHANSLKSSKNAIAMADLNLNTPKGRNNFREQNLFFRTPSPLSETTKFILTTSATPTRVQRPRNTRVANHSLDPTTQNYDSPISYSQFYTHRAERSTAAPNSLRFSKATSFDEQPVLPKRKISPSAAARAKFSNKLRHHEVSREALHHQVLQSPEEPAFIKHQKKTQFPNFPTPSVVRHPYMTDINNNIPTRTHFKAVLLEDEKENTRVQSRAPQFGQTPRVLNSENLQSRREEELANSVLYTRPASVRPGRPRLLRNSRPSLGRLPRGPNPQENFFKVFRPRNQANTRFNGFLRPPSQRRTQQRANLRPRAINKSRNRPRRTQDSLSTQESRDNFIIAPLRAPFIRTSQLNAGGHKMNGLFQQKRRVTSRPPSVPFPPPSKVQLPSYKHIHVSQRPQIVLNSRPPITSLPAHLQLSPNLSDQSRNARHSTFNNHVQLASNFHKADPIKQITRHQPRIKHLNHLPRYKTAQFPPTVKPTEIFKESKPQVRESHSRTESFEHDHHQLQSQRQPTPSSSHQYSVREIEPDHQNEISLSAISQPLPHHALLKTSRKKMAESHVSLLKNLQFGVNGEPLDVWIPMKSDRTLKLVGRGQTFLTERARVRPRNSLPIPVDQHFDSTMAEKVDPLHTSESMTVSEYAIKDVMDGDKDFDYNDYDEYKDRLDEPQAATSVEEVMTLPKQKETEDYPDAQDSPFEPSETNVDDDQAHQEEQEDDEEEVFEEDDDDL